MKFVLRILFATIAFFTGICWAFAAPRSAPRRDVSSISLVSGSKVSVRTPLNPTKEELNAASFLSDTLRRISKGAKVSVNGDTSSSSIYFVRSKGKCDSNKIGFSFSGGNIEIIYASSADVWSAVGEFLRIFCGAEMFAPSNIGFEFSKIDSISSSKKYFEMRPSFLGRDLMLSKRGERTYALLNGESKKYVRHGHSLSLILNKRVLSENPTWRAEQNSPHPNFFNLEMRSFVAGKFLKIVEDAPNEKLVSLGIDDTYGFGNFPHMERVRRGFLPSGYADVSNAVFDFTNFIAKNLELKYPEKFVSQFAYMYTENPPDFKVAGNVAVFLATDKGAWFDADARKRDKMLVESWAKSGAGLLGVHDYNYGQSYFIPRDISDYIIDSVKLYAANGFKSYSSETYPVWAYDAHKLYILTRLLKDSSLDGGKLRDEFFERYYRESASHISEFFAIARKAWAGRTDKAAWLKLFKRHSQAEVLSESDIKEMDSALLNAEKTAYSYRVQMRVKEIRLVWEITKQIHRIYFLKKSLVFETANKTINFESVIDKIEATKIAENILEYKIKSYEQQTKYPIADFRFWTRIDFINTSDFASLKLAALNAPAADSELRRLYYRDFPRDARAALSGKNLLINSSFEYGLAAWNQNAAEDCKYVLETISDKSGNRSLKISSPNFAGINQNVSIKESSFYALTFSAKGKIALGDVLYARLLFKDKGGRVLGSKYCQLPSANYENFTNFGIVAEAPKNAVIADCSIIVLNFTTNNAVLVDDVRLLSAPVLN